MSLSEQSKENKKITELVDQREFIILYFIALDWIESDQIRVSRSEWIRSEQTDWIVSIGPY